MALDLVLLEQIRNNKIVDLSINSGLSIEEIGLLVEALPQCINLRSIDLSWRHIGAEGAKALAKVLPQCINLQNINLRGNNIGAEGATALAKVLPQCHNLQNIDVGGNNIEAAGATALAKVLPQCHNLQNISLMENRIGDEGVKALAIAFPQCTNLQSIDVRSNRIAADGAEALAKELPQCINLHSIDLAYNHIRAKGAEALAKELPQCINLQNISLIENRIGDEGAEALARALPQCINLHNIDLRVNNIGDEGKMAILSAIQKNQYVTSCEADDMESDFQSNINAICNANKERIKSAYQVTALDQSLQNESLYEKLYSCRLLTRAIEENFIPVAQIHALLQGKSIEKINLLEIRDQSISEMLKEHYTNPALSGQRQLFLEGLLENNFYGYDAIPTIIECGHFTFAQDLIESSEITSCDKYFTPLIDAAFDPKLPDEYRLLSNVILSRIYDLRSNPYYMQEAIDKSKVTLVQSLIEHHAAVEGVTIKQQQGFSEDAIIADIVGALQTQQEELAEVVGELPLEPEGL